MVARVRYSQTLSRWMSEEGPFTEAAAALIDLAHFVLDLGPTERAAVPGCVHSLVLNLRSSLKRTEVGPSRVAPPLSPLPPSPPPASPPGGVFLHFAMSIIGFRFLGLPSHGLPPPTHICGLCWRVRAACSCGALLPSFLSQRHSWPFLASPRLARVPSANTVSTSSWSASSKNSRRSTSEPGPQPTQIVHTLSPPQRGAPRRCVLAASTTGHSAPSLLTSALPFPRAPLRVGEVVIYFFGGCLSHFPKISGYLRECSRGTPRRVVA